MLLQRGDPADQARVIELFEAALAAGQAGDSPARIATAQLNLGRAGIEFGDLDPAEQHLQIALETFRSVDDPVGLAHTQETLGLLYLRRGEPDTARRWFQRARAKYAFLRDQAGLRRVDAVMP